MNPHAKKETSQMSNRSHDKDTVELGGESDEATVFIDPNIEHKLSKEKRQECRDIVQEIKRFGINQRQVLFLIQLLAMELESGTVMRALLKTIGEIREEIPVGNKVVQK